MLAGLRAPQKHIPAKYFYDETGSQLFERITELPEYYPTRCEMSILRDRAAEIARLIAPGAAIVEFGSGSNKKARLLLEAAEGEAPANRNSVEGLLRMSTYIGVNYQYKVEGPGGHELTVYVQNLGERARSRTPARRCA